MKPSILLLIAVVLLITGCADPNPSTVSDTAGFWRGIWHGMCAPFALIGIMFGADIGVYQTVNSGNWYNFGFLLGCGSSFSGGSSCSARCRKS